MKLIATCHTVATQDGKGLASLEIWDAEDNPMGVMQLTDLPLEKARAMLDQTFELTLVEEVAELGGG